jgi:HD-GYP domain-containing protein (c-di-GMP phosphodiesterase class II)
VAPIVYHHHERYDGTGYVDGLSGEEIPLASRILAVADAFVSMTSHDPRRPQMSVAEGLEEMKRNAGTQFDPRVVEALVGLLAEQPAHEEGASALAVTRE